MGLLSKTHIDLSAGSGHYGDSIVVGSLNTKVISVEEYPPFMGDRMEDMQTVYPDSSYYKVSQFQEKIQRNHAYVIANPIQYLREINNHPYSISLCFPSYGFQIESLFDALGDI